MKTTFIGSLLTLMTTATLMTASQGAEPSANEDQDLRHIWQQMPIALQVETTMQKVKKFTGQAPALSDVAEFMSALDQSQMFQSLILVRNQLIDGDYHFEIKATVISNSDD
ncbi:hypothetical protein [Marinicella meishanensis]|uniref:hypothetical protein n=1 Tax=Marinicella meishanensis TaxID=2873263 RepID=UPI001CBECD5E|nr:hypothetical protein [Marinicella sp. NBU2979]